MRREQADSVEFFLKFALHHIGEACCFGKDVARLECFNIAWEPSSCVEDHKGYGNCNKAFLKFKTNCTVKNRS